MTTMTIRSSRPQGSISDHATAAVVIELLDDGTYKVLKNRFGTSEPMSAIIRVDVVDLVVLNA